MVDYQDLLQRLKELKDGAAADAVEVPTALLSTTVDGLAELQEELQNAKDMLMMKPSMAKKLNERIRLLEEQLEQLRAKNKVKDMEKKIQNLQAELKASYATKNFTLKNNLLELEKKYQSQLTSNAELAEMWSDVAAILNEDAKEVMPSYMSRSATFLRVGTMARPGAPLTHGQPHNMDHIPEAEADVEAVAVEEAAPEPLSAVQAVKQRLEVKIEQATREAALSGNVHLSAVPAPSAPATAADHRRAASASSDGKSAETEVATTPNMSVDEAKEHFRNATAPVNTGAAPTPPASAADHKRTASAEASSDSKSAEVEVAATPNISVDDAKDQFRGATAPVVADQGSTSSFLHPAAAPADAEASTAEQQEHVKESLSVLRTIYASLAQEVVSNTCADGSVFTRQVQTVRTHVAQLREVFAGSGVEEEADQFLDAVEELRAAYQTANTPTTDLEEKMDVVLSKVEQLRKILPAPKENGVLTIKPKPPSIPTVDTERQDSIQDIDLLTETPTLAQADVNTLVSLFSIFAQELAEQHLLPDVNGYKPADPTSTTPKSPTKADATATANEMVQYFRLYMTTQGGTVLRKLLKEQGHSIVFDSAPPTARGSPSCEPETQSTATDDVVQSTPPPTTPTPTDLPTTRHESSTPPLPSSSSLPPLSPAAPSLITVSSAQDGAASSTPTDGPSSMGKKTFSAVARAVYMLNTKYKNILPDTPQTDALFSDLANMLENVIATHELKSQASKQIIARSLKQRSSGPPSVASLGNWDSVGTPTGLAPDSPFRSGLRGPGSDGQRTPVASRTPRGDQGVTPDIVEKPSGQDEAAGATPSQTTVATPEPAAPSEHEAEVAEAHAEPEAEAATTSQQEGRGEEPTLELLSPPMNGQRVKELQNENEYLTRILIDAKVELADTKGEYMALLRALRKALSRENNARSKLEELERVVSVMAPGGPGISALQEDITLRPIRTRQTDDGQSEQTASAQPSRTHSAQEGEIQPA